MTIPTRAEAIEAMKIVKEWCNYHKCEECPIVSCGMIQQPHTWELKDA